MYLQLEGKIIVVSGGAKGIGEGIVKVLVGEGAIPVIIGRNKEDNLLALDQIDHKGNQVVAELTNPDECKRAIESVLSIIDKTEVHLYPSLFPFLHY